MRPYRDAIAIPQQRSRADMVTVAMCQEHRGKLGAVVLLQMLNLPDETLLFVLGRGTRINDVQLSFADDQTVRVPGRWQCG